MADNNERNQANENNNGIESDNSIDQEIIVVRNVEIIRFGDDSLASHTIITNPGDYHAPVEDQRNCPICLCEKITVQIN